MLKSERELAGYYRGHIETERKRLGPAPAFMPAKNTAPAFARQTDAERRARIRVDFLSGVLVAALAACCACAAPYLPNKGFAAAARAFSEIRIDGNDVMDFMRALGSPFAIPRSAVPGRNMEG